VAVLFPPDLLPEERDILVRLREGNAIEHYETRRLHKDGHEILVSVTVSPVRSPNGQIIGASKIARDVTERRAAEARLADLQSEVVHLARWNMMGMMTATIAHELNQPLAAIANYAAALKRILAGPQFSPAMVDDILEKIAKQRQRASQIVDRMRNQVARGTLERRPENLEEVIAEALELASSTVQKAGAHASMEATAPIAPVLIDRVQIQQVIINLVRNAVEAMERSSIRRVRINSVASPDGLRVDIADTGPGLPEDIASRLFEPFVTNKDSGMGLGLSICKDIIESHGGRLWAEPNAPQGTIFSFVLPVYSAEAAA
jgi:two-component system sensor kinase FixL